MKIRQPKTDVEIAACYPVMQELRPHIAEDEFVVRVRSLEKGGYQLVAMEDCSGIIAVSGFRIGENLAWGKFLYVDDLIISRGQRSRGHGARLISWLREYAKAECCQQLHLDCGIQREDAHRFYEREGLSKCGFHFLEDLSSSSAL